MQNLYAKVWDLRKPWQMVDMTVSEALKTITVFIGRKPSGSLRCPQ